VMLFSWDGLAFGLPPNWNQALNSAIHDWREECHREALLLPPC
jgi:hypothetical protein